MKDIVLHSRKECTVADLTDFQIKLLEKYEKHENLGFDECFWKYDDNCNDEDVVILGLQWNGKKIIDIFGYPGDNENGGVFIQNNEEWKLIAVVGDGTLEEANKSDFPLLDYEEYRKDIIYNWEELDSLPPLSELPRLQIL